MPSNDKLIADGLRRLARRVIRQTLQDFATAKPKDRADIEAYLKGSTLSTHIRWAGYPEEVRDSLVSLVLISEAQRPHACEEIMALLSEL